MGKRHRVQGTARSTATPSAVFDVLVDRPSWPTWSQLGRYEHVSGTEGHVGGTGRLITGPIKSVERITAVEPDHLYAYELVSGLPLRDYAARVELSSDGDGTQITWTGTFDAVPGVGFVMEKMLGRVLQDLTSALAERAAR